MKEIPNKNGMIISVSARVAVIQNCMKPVSTFVYGMKIVRVSLYQHQKITIKNKTLLLALDYDSNRYRGHQSALFTMSKLDDVK